MSKCMNCGNDIPSGAAYCTVCGAPTATKQCPVCHRELAGGEAFCPGCGATLGQGAQNVNTPPRQFAPQQKSRLVAGLLGVFLGSLGIHSFYLGNTARGVAQILTTFFSCGIGGIWGFVEGILILCRSINTDANGLPLKDDC